MESFLIHYRNLIDFLSPTGQVGTDDILASDFAPGFMSTSTPIQYRKQINKRLAHLSDERLETSDENKPWNIGMMLDEMSTAWDEFDAFRDDANTNPQV